MSSKHPVQRWRGRLNSFQQMMLNWEDLHPYNAVHAFELPYAVLPQRVREAIVNTLEGLGVSAVEFDSARRRYDFHPSAGPPEFRVVRCPGDAESALPEEFSSELNRPFPKGRHSPFRFFFIESASSKPYLGVTYHHAVGDASSVSKILKKILLTVTSVDAPPPDLHLDLFPPRVGRLFASEVGFGRAGVLLKSLGRDWVKYKKCHVPGYWNEEDQEIGFGIYGMGCPVETLKDMADEFGATVQDIIFAAMLEGIGKLVPERERAGRRRKNIALATAVDLRRHADQPLENTLGQYLGSYSVSHSVPDDVPFSRLVSDVAAQTNRVKEERSYFSHVWSFSVMAFLWPLMPRTAKRNYARWLFPLMGAISNMNFSDSYAEIGIRHYFRAASTGPIFPILVDITTVGDTYSLTAMYRKSAFSSSDIETLMTHMKNRLTRMYSGTVNA